MSEPGGYVAAMLREAMHAYWRSFDRAIDYFVLHHVFEALCLVDERFRATWERTPAVSREAPAQLRRAMAAPYSPAALETLLDGCFVHKLTHKYDPGTIPPGSMLAHLLEHGAPEG